MKVEGRAELNQSSLYVFLKEGASVVLVILSIGCVLWPHCSETLVFFKVVRLH